MRLLPPWFREYRELRQALSKGQKVPFDFPAALALAKFAALVCVVCDSMMLLWDLLFLGSVPADIGADGGAGSQLEQFLIRSLYGFLVMYASSFFFTFVYLRHILAADGRDSPWSLGLRALVFACFTVFCLWLLSLTHGRNIFSSRDFLLDLTVCFCVGCWFIPRINALRLKEQAKEKSKETNG